VVRGVFAEERASGYNPPPNQMFVLFIKFRRRDQLHAADVVMRRI
jgi:hypothetical protein